MTRQDIRRHQEQQQREREEAARASEREAGSTHLDGELVENLNKARLNENEASNIDDAIEVLR